MKVYKHKPLALTDKLYSCVRFACWCMDQHMKPYDAGQLHALAKRVYYAATREANGGLKADREREQFTQFAATFGFGVVYDGLTPTLTTAATPIDGSKVYLCPNL